MRKTELTKSMLDNRTSHVALRKRNALMSFVSLLKASTLFVLLGWASSVSAQCTLSCNSAAQVSLPGPGEGCEAVIGHPMILTNSFLVCPGEKTVTVYDGAGLALPTRTYNDGMYTHIGSVVDATYEGQTLTVGVVDQTTNNECWGTIKIEDKLGPQFTNCNDTTLYCIQDPRPHNDTIGGIMGGEVIAPDVNDCMGAASLIVSHVDQITNGTCTDGFSSVIRRTWTAVDQHGNVTTCVQTITLLRVSLADVTPTCPPNVSLDCTDPAALPDTRPDSLPVGFMFPTINIGGNDIDVVPGSSAFCSLAASYSDEEYDLCGVGKKILRTWTIYDWCVDIGPGNPWSCIQVVKFEDTTGPTIVGGCGAPVNASTEAHDCDGDVALPGIVTTDCSDVTVIINSNYGVLNSNGGVIENVPAGQHVFTYIATDDCGNSTACSKVVNVEDNVPPVAVCDEFTVVSLTSDGTGKVYATTFNDGSSDNCELSHFEVRRMENACQDDTIFDEYAYFTCCDLGDTVQVSMRVFDKNLNYNECMVEVWVQDKLPPTVTCPPDKTVDCSEDLIDLARFGDATATDNCDSIVITEVIRRGTDNCGIGVIRRIFRGTDSDGRVGTCTQRITVRNNDLFEYDDIEWPLDWTTDQCGASTDPDDIPCNRRNYCRPILDSNSCGHLAVTYTDQVLAINNACFKVLRTWVVVDWCQYDPNDDYPVGYWDWVQTIKVVDEDAPVIDCPADTMLVEHFDADCIDIDVSIPAFTATDCSNDLTFEVRIDYDNNGSYDTIVRGNDASGVYQGGFHRLLVVASDGCGNTATCEFYLDIVDRKKPSAVCFNGLSATLMPDGLGSGMITLIPMMFNNKSFDNCTAMPDLKLEIFPADFTCDDIGMQLVRLEVTDLAGNMDFCETFVDIQDNMGACSGNTRPGSIGGSIKDNSGAGVQGVRVDLNTGGSVLSSYSTTADGSYMFSDLQQGADYTVTPVLNDEVDNGVSTFDLLLISRHILNVEKLDSPYKIIAADANRTGNVSTLDLVAIRKVILKTATDFPNNTSWRFLDKNYVFANPTAPLDESFREVMNYNNLAGDMDVSDFMAIKVGDVNDDAKANQILGVDGRTFNGTLNFATEDIAFEANQTIAIPFTADDFQEIAGYQFTFDFDETALTLNDIETNEALGLTKGNFGFSMTDEGIITTSWDNSKTTQIVTGTEVLFTLHFQTQTAGKLSEAIAISSEFTTAEAYASLDANNPDIKNVSLRFSNADVAATDFELYQNNPNPFTKMTTIGFQLPVAAQATLTVFDLAGKVLKVYNGDFEKGYNQIRVSNNDIPASGVLYYRLETSDHTATKKMILVK